MAGVQTRYQIKSWEDGGLYGSICSELTVVAPVSFHSCAILRDEPVLHRLSTVMDLFDHSFIALKERHQNYNEDHLLWWDCHSCWVSQCCCWQVQNESSVLWAFVTKEGSVKGSPGPHHCSQTECCGLVLLRFVTPSLRLLNRLRSSVSRSVSAHDFSSSLTQLTQLFHTACICCLLQYLQRCLYTAPLSLSDDALTDSFSAFDILPHCVTCLCTTGRCVRDQATIATGAAECTTHAVFVSGSAIWVTAILPLWLSKPVHDTDKEAN